MGDFGLLDVGDVDRLVHLLDIGVVLGQPVGVDGDIKEGRRLPVVVGHCSSRLLLSVLLSPQPQVGVLLLLLGLLHDDTGGTVSWGHTAIQHMGLFNLGNWILMV